jgi:hypothetical protein
MVALVLRASPPGEAAIMNVNDVLLLEVVTMMMTMPLLLDITITTHCYLFSGKIKYDIIWIVNFGLAADFLDHSRVESIGKRSILCLKTTTNR